MTVTTYGRTSLLGDYNLLWILNSDDKRDYLVAYDDVLALLKVFGVHCYTSSWSIVASVDSLLSFKNRVVYYDGEPLLRDVLDKPRLGYDIIRYDNVVLILLSIFGVRGILFVDAVTKRCLGTYSKSLKGRPTSEVSRLVVALKEIRFD